MLLCTVLMHHTTLHTMQSSALHGACRAGTLSIVRDLLKTGANINAQTAHGESLLFVAAEEGKREVVRYLLVHDADASLANKDGYSPLHVAAFHHRHHIVTYLLVAGANSAAQDIHKRTPLQTAQLQCQLSGQKKLFKRILKILRNAPTGH